MQELRGAGKNVVVGAALERSCAIEDAAADRNSIEGLTDQPQIREAALIRGAEQ